ncbi:MAG: class I SAM-dependent methyltransferase [Chloroflexi bacterium]|nr:class I SAM-dependent methyltransferase [Chloroflexota bacterium]
MDQFLIKDYTEYDFLAKYNLLNNQNRILNAGSSSLRYGNNCINIDIEAKPNVDVVCDMQALPDSLGKFNVVICNAALQYCSNPQQVADEFLRVLNPGGFVFLDVPWIFPSCPEPPDRFRFSEDGLRALFSNFEIVEVGPSIRAGSAFAILGWRIASRLTNNKYLNKIFKVIALVLLYPFQWLKATDNGQTAGAFYIICRKTTL